jgi:hypothetical protein
MRAKLWRFLGASQLSGGFSLLIELRKIEDRLHLLLIFVSSA